MASTAAETVITNGGFFAEIAVCVPAEPGLDSPRIRFNWGYHDGAQAARNGWTPMWKRGEHFNASYEAGYWAGHADQVAGTYAEHSEAAWMAHQAGA